MFKASITLAPGFPAGQPAHFELLATVNSSDNGDTWRMRLSFRRADGSEVFSLPPANWWMGVAIAQKDAPQEWVFAGDPNYPQLSEVPSNFAEAVSVHLYADC